MFLWLEARILGQTLEVIGRLMRGFHVRGNEFGSRLGLLRASLTAYRRIGLGLKLQRLVAARTTDHHCCADDDKTKNESLHGLVSQLRLTSIERGARHGRGTLN